VRNVARVSKDWNFSRDIKGHIQERSLSYAATVISASVAKEVWRGTKENIQRRDLLNATSVEKNLLPLSISCGMY